MFHLEDFCPEIACFLELIEKNPHRYIVLLKLGEKKAPTKNQSVLSYMYPAVTEEHEASHGR